MASKVDPQIITLRYSAALSAGNVRERLAALAEQTGLSASMIHGKALLLGLGAIEADPALLIRPEGTQAAVPAPEASTPAAPPSPAATVRPAYRDDKGRVIVPSIDVAALLLSEDRENLRLLCRALDQPPEHIVYELVVGFLRVYRKRLDGESPQATKDEQEAFYRTSAAVLLKMAEHGTTPPAATPTAKTEAMAAAAAGRTPGERRADKRRQRAQRIIEVLEHYLAGKSPMEIASAMGTTAGTAKKWDREFKAQNIKALVQKGDAERLRLALAPIVSVPQPTAARLIRTYGPQGDEETSRLTQKAIEHGDRGRAAEAATQSYYEKRDRPVVRRKGGA